MCVLCREFYSICSVQFTNVLVLLRFPSKLCKIVIYRIKKDAHTHSHIHLTSRTEGGKCWKLEEEKTTQNESICEHKIAKSVVGWLREIRKFLLHTHTNCQHILFLEKFSPSFKKCVNAWRINGKESREKETVWVSDSKRVWKFICFGSKETKRLYNFDFEVALDPW